jgi:NAD(P)-dependent dehydrogenase (short-subunit alcohol dehydrogenase family)
MTAPRLEGRFALITGASRGIGRAVAQRFAAEGATVAINHRDDGAAADAALASLRQASRDAGHGDPPHRVEEADVARPDAVGAMVDRVVAAWGRLDVLVNNAGINRRGNLLALSDEDWNTSFAVNLDSMFHLCRAALPHMIAGGGGAIVNTASQWGLYPAPNHIAYNTTKAAVAAFTQNLARDYAPDKVRVNAVCPGEIHTPMLEAGVTRSGRTIADLDKLVPYGRIGRPEEVAALVAFLASDEAAFMCGSLVEITGAQAVA